MKLPKLSKETRKKIKDYSLGVTFGLSLVALAGLLSGLVDITPCVGPYELTDQRLAECMAD